MVAAQLASLSFYADKLDEKIPEDFWEGKMADWRAEEQQVKLAMDDFAAGVDIDRAVNAEKVLELANKAHLLWVVRQQDTRCWRKGSIKSVIKPQFVAEVRKSTSTHNGRGICTKNKSKSENERKALNPKLAMYIRIARHHMDGTPLDEEDRISQQKAAAIEEFQINIARKVDIVIRMELFFHAHWFWDATGPAVRFSVDGQSFLLLARQDGSCYLFLEADGNKIPLTVLLDEDKQFADHFLAELGDALERTMLMGIQNA